MDSKDPDAKPLPVDKMMVHHFLYYTPGPRRSRPGRLPRRRVPRRARGGAPERALRRRLAARAAGALRRPQRDARRAARRRGSLTAMVMNHYKQPKRFYVRTKRLVHDRAAPQVYPVTVGNCAHLGNGMAYDVPGGGKPGSTFVDRSTWTVPFSARILGGGVAPPRRRDCTRRCSSVTCGRTLFDAKAYYGARRPPVQHDPPDPARARADRQRHVPARRRASRSRRGRCSSARPCTPTSSCTWPRWASGSCSSSATTA